MATSKKTLKYYTVDAFTSEPFSGNQAAVIVFPGNDPYPDDKLLQTIAAEFNYSETAYIRKHESSSPNDFELRWFTPAREVPLCGHATLASACVLRNHQDVLSERLTGNLVFHSRYSGQLIVDISSKDGTMLMDFPADPPSSFEMTATQEQLAETLGLPKSKILNVETSTKLQYVVIELDPSVDITAMKVDSGALGQLVPKEQFVQTVTALSPEGTLLCRVFGAKAGIPEDPVTGSVYTVLGPYWKSKTGRTSFNAHQCSKRGGDVTVEVQDTGRVIVGGKATEVMQGTLFY